MNQICYCIQPQSLSIPGRHKAVEISVMMMDAYKYMIVCSMLTIVYVLSFRVCFQADEKEAEVAEPNPQHKPPGSTFHQTFGSLFSSLGVRIPAHFPSKHKHQWKSSLALRKFYGYQWLANNFDADQIRQFFFCLLIVTHPNYYVGDINSIQLQKLNFIIGTLGRTS